VLAQLVKDTRKSVVVGQENVTIDTRDERRKARGDSREVTAAKHVGGVDEMKAMWKELQERREGKTSLVRRAGDVVSKIY